MQRGYLSPVAVIILALSGSVTLAQSTATQASLPSAPAPVETVAVYPDTRPASRFDVFGGYSFIDLRANVNGYSYSEIDGGPIGSATIFLTRRFGVEGEFAYHEQNSTNCFISARGGPVFRLFVHDQLSPFIHAEGGETKMGIKYLQTCAWNPGFNAGGGLDYIFSSGGNRVALRIIQADYEYVRLQYNLSGTSGATNVNVPRLSTGLVVRLGEFEQALPRIPKAMQCHATPPAPYAGERILLAALAKGYDFKAPYAIHWTSTGGTVLYPGPDVLVDTTGLAAGRYSASATLTRGKSKKALVQCTVPFEVQTPPPLTVQCSASPSAVNAGDTVTLTTTASNPAERKLTYSYKSTDGRVRLSGSTARLDTTGAAPGTLTVTCRAQDDLGRTAESTADIKVIGPAAVTPATTPPAATPTPVNPPAAAPQAELPRVPLSRTQVEQGCSVSFDADAANSTRLAPGSAACLSDIASKLEQRPGTRLTLVGNHDANEPDGAKHAAERASNVKTYLVGERHIDPARIDVRTGSSIARSVETYILAPGATFDPPPTKQSGAGAPQGKQPPPQDPSTNPPKP